MTRETVYLRNHPREMFWLSLTEMCQRFGFWGVGNLLVLYLVQIYHYSDGKATHLYGLYSGIAFVLPVLGGYITDRWNYKHPVVLGFILAALGCLFLATGITSLLYPALLALALGGSVFTPCIYTLLSKAYIEKHHLREIGFSIYYSAVNIGVFLAMLILGIMVHYHGWRAVFITCGLVQLVGLLAFIKAIRCFTKKQLEAKSTRSAAMKSNDRERLLLIIYFCLISLFFWTAYSQNGSSIILFAYQFTDRHLGGFLIPPTWFIGMQTLFLLLLVLPTTYLYLSLRKRNKEPSPPLKTVFSLIAMGICFTVLVLAGENIPLGSASAAKSPLYLVVAFVFMAISELLIAPISLSLITNLSPKRLTAFFVGLWYFTLGISYYIGGYLAGLIETVRWTRFFSLFVVSSFLIAFITLMLSQKLNRMRHLEDFPKNRDPSM